MFILQLHGRYARLNSLRKNSYQVILFGAASTSIFFFFFDVCWLSLLVSFRLMYLFIRLLTNCVTYFVALFIAKLCFNGVYTYRLKMLRVNGGCVPKTQKPLTLSNFCLSICFGFRDNSFRPQIKPKSF